MADAIVVTRTVVDPETGVHVDEVHGFPRETSIDFFVLGQADRDHLSVSDAEVTLTFANGQATYRLALSECDGASTAIPAYLISSRFTEPTHARVDR